MIRFIDLGKQIALDETDPKWPRQFAFFDTIVDQFIKINGYVVFDSLADLLSEMSEDDGVSQEFANRLLRLCPDWGDDNHGGQSAQFVRDWGSERTRMCSLRRANPRRSILCVQIWRVRH